MLAVYGHHSTAAAKQTPNIGLTLEKLPRAIPAIKDARTVLTARTVSPKSRCSIRVQATS